MPVPDELPLLSLYLAERCNSRCVTCEHWRTGRDDLSLDRVRALLPDLRALGTRIVQLSGGEPLLHREWRQIACLLRDAGLQVWLLTAGLALAKHAQRVADHVDTLIVSLDGADRDSYRAIRGVDAFDAVCEGIRAVAARGLRPTLRVTLQRRNFAQMAALVRLARTLGAQRISFLAVDTANTQAFGRDRPEAAADLPASIALRSEDLPELDRVLSRLEAEFAADFASGFIAESPRKLRRIQRHFAAACGATAYPGNECRAPEFSAVMDAKGRVAPCFFIAGSDTPATNLRTALAAPAMRALREAIRGGARRECHTCVCSASRAPASAA